MLLKYYLDQGVSKAELSRRFGVNRRTIHYWIETGQLDRDLSAGARGYSPRPPVPRHSTTGPVRDKSAADMRTTSGFNTMIAVLLLRGDRTARCTACGNIPPPLTLYPPSLSDNLDEPNTLTENCTHQRITLGMV